MITFFGCRIKFEGNAGRELWHSVLRNMTEAIRHVWSVVPVNPEIRRQLQQVDAFEGTMCRMIEEPETMEDWAEPTSGEIEGNFAVHFSPYSRFQISDFPSSAYPGIAFQHRDVWETSATVAVNSSVMDMDDRWEEDAECFRSHGVHGLAPPMISTDKLPYFAHGQQEFCDDLIKQFNSVVRTHTLENRYWQFNSRALAFVCSAVWASASVNSVRVLADQPDD